MEALRVAAAIGVPWLLGFAWLRALSGATRANACVEWGYGHFLGILVLTLSMRLVGLLGIPLSFRVLLPLLLVLTAIGFGAARYLARGRRVDLDTSRSETGDTVASRGFAIFVLVLLAIRVATLAVDVTLRPLTPWDSWTQWATKARVWSQLHAFVPFIPLEAWLQGVPGYTDSAPGYPATIPLLQAWMAIAQGRFDDATMNLAWLAGYVALGLAIYGQLRMLRMSRSWALFATYAVLSLPLLDAHIALSGYADFHVAAAFALSVLALVAWEQDRARVQLLLVTLPALLLPLLKVPGLVWGAVIVLGWLVAAFGTSWKRVVLFGIATLAAAGGIAAVIWRDKIASVAGGISTDVLGSLVDNLFLFDNWHLLWFVFPLAMAIGWRDAVTRMRGATVALAAGGVFLLVVFGGTRVGAWVTDYTTVNRALLHIAPAAALYAAILCWHWALVRDSAPGSESAASRRQEA
jgi:hypothetical protein